jgi:hypothetical protein
MLPRHVQETGPAQWMILCQGPVTPQDWHALVSFTARLSVPMRVIQNDGATRHEASHTASTSRTHACKVPSNFFHSCADLLLHWAENVYTTWQFCGTSEVSCNMHNKKLSAARQQFSVRGSISVTSRPRRLEGSVQMCDLRVACYPPRYHTVQSALGLATYTQCNTMCCP